MLAASEVLAGLRPAEGMSASAIAPSSAPGASEAGLVSRGLLGSAMFGEQSRHNLITPPSGVEVDETRPTESQTGQVLMQLKSWNEATTPSISKSPLCPSHQYEVAFWQFPNHRPGCTMFNGRYTTAAARKADFGATIRPRSRRGRAICRRTCIQMQLPGRRFYASSTLREREQRQVESADHALQLCGPGGFR